MDADGHPTNDPHALDPGAGGSLLLLGGREYGHKGFGLSLMIAIGPEGGWSPRDRQQLSEAGFQGLQLGPRILRTETAGLAAIAALQARLGDL